jgi:arylsulfatase A-like enzyme
MYEHMVRVPFMIRVPEKFGGQNNRRIRNLDVVNVDFVPTVLELCGIEPGDNDGISLRPLLTGQKGQRRRDYVISEYYSKQQWVNPIRMIRTADFKYNLYIKHGEELYDLQNDPHEVVNLAQDADYAAIKKSLRVELEEWIRRHSDPFFELRNTNRQGVIL